MRKVKNMMARPRVFDKVFQFAVLIAVMGVLSQVQAPSQAYGQSRDQAKSQEPLKIGENTTIIFATVEQGKKILTSRDDFVTRMSPFDRSARLKTDRDVSEKKYLAFVGENVLAWDDAEKQKITSDIQGLLKELNALALPFPTKVFMIKTTGKEEGNAPYTRANAIIFPQADLTATTEEIQQAISHELFHVLSRENPDLREKLYTAIGFEKCDEVTFPSHLKSRKITNPDAPINDHCIRLQFEGKDRWAVPIIFSGLEKYDLNQGGEFFDYLVFRFLLVDRDGDTTASNPLTQSQKIQDHKPKLINFQQATGFYEQVGNNTGYIIHPEEILASNFALLVTGKRDLPSPEIIEKMKGLLKP